MVFIESAAFFIGEKTKELLTKGSKYFYELFSIRNLLALSVLHKEIKKKEFIYISDIGKWYFKEDVDLDGKVKPIDFIPVHQRNEVKSATLDDIIGVVFMNLIKFLTELPKNCMYWCRTEYRVKS